jgi:hypothetical protein
VQGRIGRRTRPLAAAAAVGHRTRSSGKQRVETRETYRGGEIQYTAAGDYDLEGEIFPKTLQILY